MSLNQDLENLSTWLPQITCPSMERKPKRRSWVSTLMNHVLNIGDSVIEINGFPNILGVHIDDKLSLRPPINYFKDGLCQGWSSEAT